MVEAMNAKSPIRAEFQQWSVYWRFHIDGNCKLLLYLLQWKLLMLQDIFKLFQPFDPGNQDISLEFNCISS